MTLPILILKYAILDCIPPGHPVDLSNSNSAAPHHIVLCSEMIHRRLHTLFDFGSELEVAEAISQSTSGESINSPDECDQTLLYKAAVGKKRLVLKALINHPLIDVDMSKARNCPLLWVISAGDYKSMSILLKHPRFFPNDLHACVSKAFGSKDVRLLPQLISHPCRNSKNQPIPTTPPVPPMLQNKPSPPAEPHIVRPPQPPPPPPPVTQVLQPTQQIVPFASSALVNTSVPILPQRVESPVRTAQEWSWLAVRLHKTGFDYQLVRDLERKLVVQEGFVTAELFASLPAAELTFAYLDRIGIVGKGLQLGLMQLHRTLQPTNDKQIEPQKAPCQHESIVFMQETLRELTNSNAILQQMLRQQQSKINAITEKLAAL